MKKAKHQGQEPLSPSPTDCIATVASRQETTMHCSTRPAGLGWIETRRKLENSSTRLYTELTDFIVEEFFPLCQQEDLVCAPLPEESSEVAGRESRLCLHSASTHGDRSRHLTVHGDGADHSGQQRESKWANLSVNPSPDPKSQVCLKQSSSIGRQRESACYAKALRFFGSS